mmetsp:Transcript_7185/g.12263  ORF Transcript_7185/g.12263 Transcript_7185/m.12263 type:complete len:267 (+) Transcript_7185:872-1672(+)
MLNCQVVPQVHEQRVLLDHLHFSAVRGHGLCEHEPRPRERHRIIRPLAEEVHGRLRIPIRSGHDHWSVVAPNVAVEVGNEVLHALPHEGVLLLEGHDGAVEGARLDPDGVLGEAQVVEDNDVEVEIDTSVVVEEEEAQNVAQVLLLVYAARQLVRMVPRLGRRVLHQLPQVEALDAQIEAAVHERLDDVLVQTVREDADRRARIVLHDRAQARHAHRSQIFGTVPHQKEIRRALPIQWILRPVLRQAGDAMACAVGAVGPLFVGGD